MKTYERIGIWITVISTIILISFALFKLFVIEKQLSFISSYLSTWEGQLEEQFMAKSIKITKKGSPKAIIITKRQPRRVNAKRVA